MICTDEKGDLYLCNPCEARAVTEHTVTKCGACSRQHTDGALFVNCATCSLRICHVAPCAAFFGGTQTEPGFALCATCRAEATKASRREKSTARSMAAMSLLQAAANKYLPPQDETQLQLAETEYKALEDACGYFQGRPAKIAANQNMAKASKKKKKHLVPWRALSTTGMSPLPTRRKINFFASRATGCLSSVGQVLFMATSPSLARVGRQVRQSINFKVAHRYTQSCVVSYRVLIRVLIRRCKTVTSWVLSAFFKPNTVAILELRLLFATSLVKNQSHLYVVWYIT